jgi:hypothetical protein
MRLALAALAVLLAAGPAAAQPLTRLPAVVHVHSDVSTGELSLDALAAAAERQGLGAVLLAENYLLRIDYGLPPFRALTRVSREERSVLGGGGTAAFLARVAEAQRAHPSVILVPGVELVPHYFWTGSPWSGVLTLHDVQKNLIVFGIDDPHALATLPVIGRPPAGRYTAQSALDAAPVALLVPGLVLLLRKRTYRRRLRRGVVVVRRRRWVAGLACLAVAAVALVRGWPFTEDLYPAYEDFGVRPYQAVIDRVDALGGVTLWSFPEAPDSGGQLVGPVRVTWDTAPYGDDLLKTFRYTSFGGLYEQATPFVAPGGGWDRILREAAAHERSRPAWAIGEAGFHGPGAGKRLGNVQTVFLVAERSARGILDAYRRGRMYAVMRAPDTTLVLEDWSVVAGATTAGAGDTVRTPAETPIEVRVAVAAADGGAQPVRVLLLRDGSVVEAWSGTTPFRASHLDRAGAASGVWRVDVRGNGAHRILSNPVFVVGR